MSFPISMTGPSARRRRQQALAAATVGCLLAMAGPAVAATTGASVREGTFGRTPVTGRVLLVDDKSSLFASKDNLIAIDLRDGAFLVTEAAGGRVRADDGCREVADNRLRCSASGVVAIVVDAESGDDRVTITAPTRAIVTAGSGRDRVTDGGGSGELDGGSGDDTLVGGKGADVILGGDGDDRLDGGDGDDQLVVGDPFGDDAGPDILRGGSGIDSLFAADGNPETLVDCGDDPPSGSGSAFREDDRAVLDLADAASVGCETVEIAPVGQHPTVRIASRGLHVRAGGRAAIALRCPHATPGGACRGRLTLRRRDPRRILAATSYALRAGQRTRVSVTLARHRTRHLRALTAVAAEHDPDGRPKTTIKRLPVRR